MDATRAKADKGRGVGRTTRRALAVLVAVVAVLASAGVLTFRVSELLSVSMSPTLLPGDSVLVNRLIYYFRPPRHGEIIVFHFPQTDGRDFVKRVIGVPGDIVQEQDGRFTVNGSVVHVTRTALSDPTPTAATTALGPERVPRGRLYVLGDNWRTSLDSRFWGTVDERDVVGEAVLICWSHGAHWWDVRWNRVGRRLE
jgi:signal peptidase I